MTMSISDVLHGKGHQVVKVRTTDSVQTAVRKLADEHIGAVVVEDQWMRHAGIFSERDFLNAVAEHGAAALAFPVEKLMSAPIVTCRSSDRVDTALAAMTMANNGHLPVVDGRRRVALVSIGDIVKPRPNETKQVTL